MWNFSKLKLQACIYYIQIEESSFFATYLQKRMTISPSEVRSHGQWVTHGWSLRGSPNRRHVNHSHKPSALGMMWTQWDDDWHVYDIDSHFFTSIIEMFNIIIEMFMTLIAIRYSPHGMIFLNTWSKWLPCGTGMGMYWDGRHWGTPQNLWQAWLQSVHKTEIRSI